MNDTHYGIGVSMPALEMKEGTFLIADMGREVTIVKNNAGGIGIILKLINFNYLSVKRLHYSLKNPVTLNEY